MKVCIEINNAHKFQDSIDALERYLDGKPLCSDFVKLVDAIFILKGLKHEYENPKEAWNRRKL